MTVSFHTTVIGESPMTKEKVEKTSNYKLKCKLQDVEKHHNIEVNKYIVCHTNIKMKWKLHYKIT